MSEPPTTVPGREELIAAVRAAATALGKDSLNRREFLERRLARECDIDRYFDRWSELCLAAGLKATKARIDDRTLIDAMHQAFIDLGGIGTRQAFLRVFAYSSMALERRFGRWRPALIAFRAWAERERPTFPYLADLPRLDGGPGDGAPTRVWRSPGGGGAAYGEIIAFHGMRHAPTNEAGVVLLFGMLAGELGFVVEAVNAGFPDCDAKRRIAHQGNCWVRVRVEFEYQSRSFLAHGHDPAGCDLIVCWEHNWPEAPVEVLELKRALGGSGT